MRRASPSIVESVLGINTRLPLLLDAVPTLSRNFLRSLLRANSQGVKDTGDCILWRTIGSLEHGQLGLHLLVRFASLFRNNFLCDVVDQRRLGQVTLKWSAVPPFDFAGDKAELQHIPYVSYIYPTCIRYVPYMFPICQLHVSRMYPTCVLDVSCGAEADGAGEHKSVSCPSIRFRIRLTR